MALTPSLKVPPQRAAFAGDLPCSKEWYTFLLGQFDLLRQAGVDPTVIADIQTRLAELEEDSTGAFIIQGLLSVRVLGQPSGGVVQLDLVNDENAPGNTYYYGTGPTGVKGWFTVASTLAGEDSVVQDIGADGVSTFHLDGDVPAPGSLFGYGTNMAGAKGWYRPALFESTGLLDGGALSINGGDNTKFDVAAALVGFTDYSTNAASPTRAVALYGPTTANAVPNLAVIATYVGIQTPGVTLVQQSSPFTATQRRTIVPLGAVISNGTNLIAVNNLPDVMRAGINQIQDFMAAIGPMNVSGNRISPNGANININKSAGTMFKQGANFANNEDDPHNLALAALTPASFAYRTSTGVQAATTMSINVTQYESPLGTLATVPNNRFTIQRISVFTSNLIRIQYGQAVYQTLAEAESFLATEAFVTETNIAENGLLLAFLIVEKSATDLSNPAQAKFIPASKFGGPVGSGGTSITNTDALPEGTVNLYFTNERAQDAIGFFLLNTPTITFTYNDTTGNISADVNPAAVVTIAGTQTITGAKTFTSTIELTDTTATAFNGRNTGTIGLGTAITSFSGGDATTLSGIMTLRATEAWTGSAKGTRVQFRATQNTTTTLSEVASMDTQGFGVGTSTPNYGNFVKGITVEGTNCVFEMASARPDASGVLLGAFSGNFRTNSVGHQRIADVQFTTDGPTANQRGGEIGIYTKPDASTTMTKRWSVGQAGHFLPATDNAYDVGSASFRVRQYFGAIGTINTSDENTKTVIGRLTAQELAAAADLSREVITYKINDAIEAKGDDARIHVGWLAQRVRDIMAEHGLDGFRYGFLCYDEWDEQPERWNEFEATEDVWELSEEVPQVRDEEGNVTQEYVPPERVRLLRKAEPARRELVSAYRPAGSLYGLRKDELFAFIIASQEQRLQALEALLIP